MQLLFRIQRSVLPRGQWILGGEQVPLTLVYDWPVVSGQVGQLDS
jgi:hypothetical protein